MGFQKGVSGNQEGRPKKVHAGDTLAHGVFNLSSPDIPLERNEKYSSSDYIPFGNNNLFPQAIAEINRNSPIHRGIMNMKTHFLKGKGFSTEKDNKKLSEWLLRANNKNESAISVCAKLMKDKVHSGNAYVEIVTDKRRSFVNIFHKDYTTCRLSKDAKSILIHGDWENYQSKKGEVKIIPIYPQFKEEDGFLRSIIHIKTYEPQFNYYGVSDWIAAMNAAVICYKTSKWNLSRLDNSMLSSGVLLIEGNMTDKEAKKLKEDYKKEFTGEGKQGKIIFMIKQLGDSGKTAQSNFTPFNNTTEADWLALHKQSAEDLISAHSWFPSLSGRAIEGQMGNTQQIRNEYQVALATVISAEQEVFLEVFKMIIKNELKADGTNLSFRNESPVPMYDISIDKVKKVGEARKMLGLIVDDGDDNMNRYISESTSQINKSVV